MMRNEKWKWNLAPRVERLLLGVVRIHWLALLVLWVAASYSTYPLITIEHEFAGFESVFFKHFQPGGEH